MTFFICFTLLKFIFGLSCGYIKQVSGPIFLMMGGFVIIYVFILVNPSNNPKITVSYVTDWIGIILISLISLLYGFDMADWVCGAYFLMSIIVACTVIKIYYVTRISKEEQEYEQRIILKEKRKYEQREIDVVVDSVLHEERVNGERYSVGEGIMEELERTDHSLWIRDIN